MRARTLRQMTLGLVVGLLSLSAPARADGDAKAGALKIKTLQCISCHGRDGISKLPEAPNLAGQVDPYLITSLTAYRSGARKNEIMSVIAEKLTDVDIADLAAYYSAIEISVTPPAKP
ncbi:cytochrome c [Lichenihabitans sp. PAMC28606]|uniref:c-type cytochrome n=1 Tax=Lichenihabitans sp. PAMC28606 TaxID=2880932 RepID=UPI001D0BDCA9|nr:cytochrome c [Lichenihabitans sp. PAMC28606]UDL93570.1 cytochrome c [Lichenihabitans sp. PAMC28606]